MPILHTYVQMFVYWRSHRVQCWCPACALPMRHDTTVGGGGGGALLNHADVHVCACPGQV